MRKINALLIKERALIYVSPLLFQKLQHFILKIVFKRNFNCLLLQHTLEFQFRFWIQLLKKTDFADFTLNNINKHCHI